MRHPLFIHIFDDLSDDMPNGIVRIGVGTVESYIIHPRIGKHFHLPSDDPLVRGIVITVQRFAPIIQLRCRAFRRTRRVEQNVGAVLF